MKVLTTSTLIMASKQLEVVDNVNDSAPNVDKKDKHRHRRDDSKHRSPLMDLHRGSEASTSNVASNVVDVQSIAQQVSLALAPSLAAIVKAQLEPLTEDLNVMRTEVASMSQFLENTDESIPDDVTPDATLMDFSTIFNAEDSNTLDNSSVESTNIVELDATEQVLRDVEDLVKCGEEKGPAVDQRIADIISNAFKAKIQPKELKDYLLKFKLPNNISIAAPLVPENVRSKLSRQGKVRDGEFMAIQKTMINAIVPLVYNFEASLKDKNTVAAMQMFDSIRLIVISIKKLNDQRYNAMKFALPDGWKGLCEKEYPFSEQLFGSNIADTIKDISEEKRLDRLLTTNVGNKSKNAFRQSNFRAGNSQANYNNKSFFQRKPQFKGNTKNWNTNYKRK